jgi:hypothetical protein
MLENWESACKTLQALDYDVSQIPDEKTFAETQRFLSEWIEKTKAVYIGVSLPYDFSIFDDSLCVRLIINCILPVCLNYNIPFTLMLGSKKGTNPYLGHAGDSLGNADMESIESLCSNYPKNKFLVTLLSYQQQNDLAVLSSKFRNLMVFGCWWFVNNPSIVESVTKFRIELLGTTFIPQHSDSKILDHMISKWDHFKRVLTQVLIEKYRDLMINGYTLTDEQIQREVRHFLRENFWGFIDLRLN